MRVYADTSFLVKLIAQEPDSDLAVAEYRRLGKPALFFTLLHELEVRNTILQRAFYQRRSSPSSDRRHIASERDTAFDRLQHYIKRRGLLETGLEIETAMTRALELSAKHSEKLGIRAIDVLHLASALLLESE